MPYRSHDIHLRQTTMSQQSHADVEKKKEKEKKKIEEKSKKREKRETGIASPLPE